LFPLLGLYQIPIIVAAMARAHFTRTIGRIQGLLARFFVEGQVFE
jgi:hypothetical protein